MVFRPVCIVLVNLDSISVVLPALILLMNHFLATTWRIIVRSKRDAVRPKSSNGVTVQRLYPVASRVVDLPHKWILPAMAYAIESPFTTRAWLLPVAVTDMVVSLKANRARR
jgi:hypothetical protein